MRARARSLVLLTLPLGACAGAGRAPLPPPAGVPVPAPESAPEAEGPPRLAAIEGLLDLRATLVTLHYTPGSLDRAAHLQRRLEALAQVLAQLRREPPPFEVWVLAREEWKGSALERTYGLPERVGPAAFAVASWGDGEMVAAFESLLGGPVPAAREQPLRGTAAEAGALAIADALLQIEAARDFVSRTPIAGAEPWIEALLAQLVARIAFERFEPGRMPEVAAAFDAIAAAHGGARAFRLEDYAAGLALERELWYQAQLLRGADVLWVEEGETGSARWLRRLVEGREAVDAGGLERAYRGLAAWRAASFAP